MNKLYGYLDENQNVVPSDNPELCFSEKDFMKKRRVAEDIVGAFRVSTVFLGIDHSFGGKKPLWFETMVFPENELSDLYCDRYETWAQAIEGHQKAVELAKTGEF